MFRKSAIDSFFHVSPDLLDWIKIWTLRRPIHSFNTIFFNKFVDLVVAVWTRVVIDKNETIPDSSSVRKHMWLKNFITVAQPSEISVDLYQIGLPIMGNTAPHHDATASIELPCVDHLGVVTTFTAASPYSNSPCTRHQSKATFICEKAVFPLIASETSC